MQRLLSDNGGCYRSHKWSDALKDTGAVHKRTRPYRPQTNGKIERFHRTLLEEWAYIRDSTSQHERRVAYDGSCATTITTEPTALSDGPHQPQSSETTCADTTAR